MVVTARRLARSSDERGAAAVEFALILPLLILLVFGIVQFSLAYNRQQGLHAAAREGARIASLPQTTQSEITTRVNNSLSGVPFSTAPTITITPNVTKPCDQRSGLTVVVSVQGVTQVDIPLWGNQSLTLTGRGEFRCE
ncbi:MAG: TadE/TadG family type IV pilus assembly protein [Actinomycetota bacterium]